MTHHMSAARTFMGGRGFSSASAVCGLGGHRTYVASVRYPVRNGYGVRGFSSQSLSNLGGSRRISYGGYGPGSFGGYGSMGNGMGMGGQGCQGGFAGYGRMGGLGGGMPCRGEGIRGVSMDERLLKPLSVGVDPEEQKARTHEKEEMKTLNNQFACFIDKVRAWPSNGEQTWCSASWFKVLLLIR
uniref:Keratin type II head domain-containing protein n=1 Tax=Podarcis muralis TaxID=64176 RepID=A0A670KC11_PODMU